MFDDVIKWPMDCKTCYNLVYLAILSLLNLLSNILFILSANSKRKKIGQNNKYRNFKPLIMIIVDHSFWKKDDAQNMKGVILMFITFSLFFILSKKSHILKCKVVLQLRKISYKNWTSKHGLYQWVWVSAPRFSYTCFIPWWFEPHIIPICYRCDNQLWISQVLDG
jgi:hypothetical protein